MAEKCFELVPRDRDRNVCVMYSLILLPTEAVPVLEEKRDKKNPNKPYNSNNSKIVLKLLTKVVDVHMRLFAV